MNYEIHLEATPPILLEEFDQFPENRYNVGDLISVKDQGSRKVFKVLRTEPTSNPDNEKVKYFVEEYVIPKSPQSQLTDRLFLNRSGQI